MQEQEEEKNSNWKVQKAPWQQPALEILFSYINLGQKAELAMLSVLLCFVLPVLLSVSSTGLFGGAKVAEVCSKAGLCLLHIPGILPRGKATSD